MEVALQCCARPLVREAVLDGMLLISQSVLCLQRGCVNRVEEPAVAHSLAVQLLTEARLQCRA